MDLCGAHPGVVPSVGVGDKLYAALLDSPIPRFGQVETRSVEIKTELGHRTVSERGARKGAVVSYPWTQRLLTERAVVEAKRESEAKVAV